MYLRFKKPFNVGPYIRYGLIIDVDWLIKKFEELEKKKIRVLKFEGSNSELTRLNARYLNFLHNGTTCVNCGKSAAVAYLESNTGRPKPHLNLYSFITGSSNEMLTLDHIIPVSRGGQNTLSNYQCLCAECNVKKGNKILPI